MTVFAELRNFSLREKHYQRRSVVVTSFSRDKLLFFLTLMIPSASSRLSTSSEERPRAREQRTCYYWLDCMLFCSWNATPPEKARGIAEEKHSDTSRYADCFPVTSSVLICDNVLLIVAEGETGLMAKENRCKTLE